LRITVADVVAAFAIRAERCRQAITVAGHNVACLFDDFDVEFVRAWSLPDLEFGSPGCNGFRLDYGEQQRGHREIGAG
jgi:hypothetical protein